MNILRASTHQGSLAFNGQGRQCVANSVSAIIESYKLPPKFWQSTTLDKILEKGDTLYTSIAQDGHYLNFADIPQSTAMVMKSLHGTFTCETDPPFYSITDAVKLLMKDHVMTGCLLAMGGITPSYYCAILKNDYHYYIFDAHSRNDAGMVSPDGTACLTEHQDIFQVCHFIQHLAASLRLTGNIPFELATVREPQTDVHCDAFCDSTSETQSDSSFSCFESFSDGEYSCKLFLADKAVKNSLIDNPDVSDSELSCASMFSCSSKSTEEITCQINQCINNLDDSATFLNNIDSNVFDDTVLSDSDEIFTAIKIPEVDNKENGYVFADGDGQSGFDNCYVGDVGVSVNDDENRNDVVDDDVGCDDDDDDDDIDCENDDDLDYQPSDSNSSSDDVPLSNLIKKQKVTQATRSVHLSEKHNNISVINIQKNTDSLSDATSQNTTQYLQKEGSEVSNGNSDSSKVGRSRKRKRDPSTWKRNIAKARRNSGKTYTNRSGKTKPSRFLKAGCGNGCRFKCTKHFNETDRETVFHSFWKLGCINKQRQFLSKYSMKKSKKVKTTENSRRTASIVWYMPSSDGNNQKVRVCKTFFLKTVGISDKMITTAHKKLNIIGHCEDDHRGKHTVRPYRVGDQKIDMVRTHIKSFSTVESHYCRADTKRLYLSPGLNISKIYRLYKEKCISVGHGPVSEGKYRFIFNNEFNLSFHRPNKDQCDLCTSYSNASKDEKCKLELSYQRHQKNKILARENKEIDKNRAKTEPNLVACCFDLEQILLTPHAFESSFFYKRRLSSFNFTIYDLASTDGVCYLWNESIGKRGACEVASCLNLFLQNKAMSGAKRFVFYSDNCVPQNKNRFYVTMLLYSLSKYSLQSITHKYLEKGHTQNEGDSIHSSVESASRHIPVYTTGQWAAIIRTARHRRPYTVREMTPQDFIDFKKLACNIKNFDINTDNQKVQWNSIKILKFNSSAPNQFLYQTDYEGPVFTVDLFYRSRLSRPDACRLDLLSLRNKLLPIPRAKYMDLLSLCQSNIIPKAYHSFYLLLPYEED